MKKLIFFHTTNKCNSKCIFCGRQFDETKKETMSLEKFKDIYNKLKYVELINFTPMNGEPLLDETLFDKIRYARSHGSKIIFSTNGILLKKCYKEICELVDVLQISTPGLNKEEYKCVFGVDVYDDVVCGLKLLFEWKKNTDSSVKIVLVYRGDRKRDVFKDEGYLEIKKYINSSNIFHLTTAFAGVVDSWCGLIENKMLHGNMKVKKVKNFFKLIPCGEIFKTITFLPNGNKRLCPCRYYKNPDDDLVVNSNLDFFKIIFRFFTNNCPDVCKRCTYYHAYNPF